MIKQILRKRLRALSLIEISISLVIIGLIVIGATKGWQWIERTKINNTIQEIIQIQTALETYKNTNHSKPSKDAFWMELSIYGSIKPQEDSKVLSSLGATFTYIDPNIELAPLNHQQALQIKNTLTKNNSLTGNWITITDLAGNALANDAHENTSTSASKSVSSGSEKNYKLIIEL